MRPSARASVTIRKLPLTASFRRCFKARSVFCSRWRPGTGKTAVAFQICWKLWNMRWNRTGEHRRPKILYLADRNILIDDPKDKMFTTFGDARWKIETGEVNKGRELYIAIDQEVTQDEDRRGLSKS